MYIYIYIYVCIEREREIDRLIYIYIYIYRERERDTYTSHGQRTCGAECAVHLTKTRLPGNVREVWVPKGKLLAGPIAMLHKQDTSTSPLGTITHITGKC